MDWTSFVTDNFEYISHSRLEYHHGYRHAYLGEVPQAVVYGVQGGLRAYYGAGEGPPVASTLDHIVAASLVECSAPCQGATFPSTAVKYPSGSAVELHPEQDGWLAAGVR